MNWIFHSLSMREPCAHFSAFTTHTHSLLSSLSSFFYHLSSILSYPILSYLPFSSLFFFFLLHRRDTKSECESVARAHPPPGLSLSRLLLLLSTISLFSLLSFTPGPPSLSCDTPPQPIHQLITLSSSSSTSHNTNTDCLRMGRTFSFSHQAASALPSS